MRDEGRPSLADGFSKNFQSTTRHPAGECIRDGTAHSRGHRRGVDLLDELRKGNTIRLQSYATHFNHRYYHRRVLVFVDVVVVANL